MTVFFVDNNGGLHVVSLDNAGGISGVGQTTGDRYQLVTAGVEMFDTNGASQDSAVVSYRVIGQGTGNDWVLHQTLHFTYSTPEGLTAYVDNFSVDCR